jgi:hypothetical protein
MRKVNHDHEHDLVPNTNRDNHDNDNSAKAAPVAVTPKSTALASTSLEALKVALNGVDMTGITGRSGHPMLQYKSREDAWMYGQRKIRPEPDSRWAVNPASFQRGYVCFGDANKFLGEQLRPVSEPMIDPTTLPDKGHPWQVQWAVNMKCLDGSDAGVEVIYKANTDGGTQAIIGLMNEVRDRLNRDQHDGKISPIALLESDSYHGRTGIPVLTIVDWMPLDGPAPAPVAPTPPVTPPPAPPVTPPSSTAQPRRRRVG